MEFFLSSSDVSVSYIFITFYRSAVRSSDEQWHADAPTRCGRLKVEADAIHCIAPVYISPAPLPRYFIFYTFRPKRPYRFTRNYLFWMDSMEFCRVRKTVDPPTTTTTIVEYDPIIVILVIITINHHG